MIFRQAATNKLLIVHLPDPHHQMRDWSWQKRRGRRRKKRPLKKRPRDLSVQQHSRPARKLSSIFLRETHSTRISARHRKLRCFIFSESPERRQGTAALLPARSNSASYPGST